MLTLRAVRELIELRIGTIFQVRDFAAGAQHWKILGLGVLQINRRSGRILFFPKKERPFEIG